jgi:uncharacterized protein (TIGR01568 family)
MQLRETMETTSAGTGTGRKTLKHRLAAILSAFSRRGGRKRRESEVEASPPLAFPSYSRLGASNGKKQGGGLLEPRRFSVSAPKAPPMVHITIDCAGRRSVDAADPSLLPFAPLDDGRKVERRLTETGLPYETGEWEGRKCPPSSPFVAHLPPVARWRERAQSSSSRRLPTHSSSRRSRMASSSSSDDEDTRNIFSSRSFSSDSSDFYNCLPGKNATTTLKARASVSGPCRAPSRRGASQSCRYSFELPRRSAASADGGFAVVKRSDDPYQDFRKSMQEMIAEWDGEGDHRGADRLLETYLVLNSPRHYPAIVAAFADVRETFFP